MHIDEQERAAMDNLADNLMEDLNRMTGVIRLIHEDVDRLARALEKLVEKNGLNPSRLPGLGTLKAHLGELDTHVRDIREHGQR